MIRKAFLVLLLPAALNCSETPVDQGAALERVPLTVESLQGLWVDATPGFAELRLEFSENQRYARETRNQNQLTLQTEGTFATTAEGWLALTETRRDEEGTVSEASQGLSREVTSAVLLSSVLYFESYCRYDEANPDICLQEDDSTSLAGRWVSPYQRFEPHASTAQLVLRERGRLILTLETQSNTAQLRTIRTFYDDEGNEVAANAVDETITGNASPIGSGVQLEFPSANLNERLVQDADGSVLAIVGTHFIPAD